MLSSDRYHKLDKIIKWVMGLLFLLYCINNTQAHAHISGAITENKQGISLVLDLKKAPDKSLSASCLSSPPRLMVNLPVQLKQVGKIATNNHSLVHKIRYGFHKQKQILRIVLDLNARCQIISQDSLFYPDTGHHFIVRLLDTKSHILSLKQYPEPNSKIDKIASLVPKKISPTIGLVPIVIPQKPQIIRTTKKTYQKRKMVVVLDPGHGGRDPGALSKDGTKEKDIVLHVTRMLAEYLKGTHHIDVYMTRYSDIYIPLRERFAVAHELNADVFMSIHADSISRSHIRGATVYTLSNIASDREAAALAKQENRSDIIAGITLEKENPDVARVLIGLTQRETNRRSYRLGNTIVKHLKKTTPMIKPPHRQADFAVLKAPDVPSVLIELGYMSNSIDIKRLQKKSWQKQFCQSIYAALHDWYYKKSELNDE